jgi:hypothetical protein
MWLSQWWLHSLVHTDQRFRGIFGCKVQECINSVFTLNLEAAASLQVSENFC